jgi:hypothetical protein
MVVEVRIMFTLVDGLMVGHREEPGVPGVFCVAVAGEFTVWSLSSCVLFGRYVALHLEVYFKKHGK